jgi:death-on-curing family protein
MGKAILVRDLAERLGLETDELLVSLWDAGVEDYEDADDVVRVRDLGRVRRSLGVTTHKERLKVDFWLANLGISRAAFAETLNSVGLHLSPHARRVPKGALRKLGRLFPDLLHATELIPEKERASEEVAFQWEVIGQERSVRLLNEEEVQSIHAALAADFALSDDPILPPGVRNPNLLSSAVSRAATSFGRARKYPTVEMASAALFHSLIHNHPFFNGNKRTALVSLLAQLDENALVLTCTENDLFRFTLRAAQHRLVPERDHLPDREVLTISRWIRTQSRPIERGEFRMRWDRLSQRLREFGCDCVPSSSVGHRLNITRELRHPRRFPFAPRREKLSTQVAWSGDGSDAERSTIHKIRKDLHLDDEHDVDSAMFYRGLQIDAFIASYRRILQRLAKL